MTSTEYLTQALTDIEECLAITDRLDPKTDAEAIRARIQEARRVAMSALDTDRAIRIGQAHRRILDAIFPNGGRV